MFLHHNGDHVELYPSLVNIRYKKNYCIITFLQKIAECNLEDLKFYRYVHCFDSNHVPIDNAVSNKPLVAEGTMCLVSCNHKRALSTWKACQEGLWTGSGLSCEGINKTFLCIINLNYYSEFLTIFRNFIAKETD